MLILDKLGIDSGQHVHMKEKYQNNKIPVRPYLTRRERQCLQLAAEGMTSKEIAFKLGISTRMVRGHLSQARKRLDALSTTQAAVKAVRLGLLKDENEV